MKLDEFADDFLTVIRDYAEPRGLTERPKTPGRPRRDRATRRRGSTYRQTLDLLLSGLSISEVSRRRGITEGTIMSHLERLIAGGETLPLERDLPPRERLIRIEQAFADAKSWNLTPVRDLLGDDYSYEELRLVRAWLDQQSRMQDERSGRGAESRST